MDNRQKWLELFEQVNGRKPSPAEFVAAKENDFASSELAATLAAQNDTENTAESFTANNQAAAQTSNPAQESDSEPENIQTRWVNYFTELNGRKPEIEEFLAAKADNFDMSGLEAAASQKVAEEDPLSTAQEKWLAAFHEKFARDPETWEYATARDSDFSLLTLNDVEKVAESETISQASAAENLENEVDPLPEAAQAVEEDSEITKRAGKKEKKAHKKHRKGLIAGIIAAALLVILLAAGFTLNATYFSRAAQLKRYVTTYNKTDGDLKKDLKDYVWSDTKKIVKSSELNLLGSVDHAISTKEILAGTSFKKVGNQFLVFPKYKVFVEPQKLKIVANAADLNFTVNGQKVGKSNNAEYQLTLSHLFPGKYTVKADGTVSSQAIHLTSKPNLTSGEGTADFDMQFISFHLYSNLTNGDVYVGDSKIGSLTEGQYKFVNVPVLSHENLFVQKNFSDGIVKSDTDEVANISDGSSIYLNWSQELDMNAANDLMNAAIGDFSNYAEGQDVSSSVDQTFDGGQDNPFFKLFSGNIDHNLTGSTGQNANSISFDNMNITNITQTGVNTYTVTFNIRWDFSYDSSSSNNGKDDVHNGSYGDEYQTSQYTAVVKYEPGSDAQSENNEASSDPTDSSSTSSGAGDDANNFKITNVSGNPTVLKTDSSGVKAYNDNN